MRPKRIHYQRRRDPELVKKIGASTALEVRATGIPYVFAPCIAVCRDPRWGRCYESYSEDPEVVEAMTEIVPGLQGDIPANSPKGVPFVAGQKNVAACAKHYVGDGGTTQGINENNTVIDRHGLVSIHMPGYYTSIIKGVSTIMVSYSSWNGIKMHANRDLITDFLKNTLRFRGFVITDWEGLDRITSPPHANYSYSIQVGIKAGIDMVMVPFNYTEFIDGLTFQVKNNIIPMSRIDDAVMRILRVKFVMGLFENPLADYSLVDQLGSQNPDAEFVKSNDFSYAIVVVGEHPYAETQGDSMNLTIADPGPSTITNVCGAVKCVVIIISGRPVVIQPFLNSIDALVAAWLPGTEGQGVADVLFGDYASEKAEHVKYKDPKQPLNVRIKDLIGRMTLEEKIGQMVQIERAVASAEVMKKYFIGSVLSGGGSVPAPKASAKTWLNMVNEFQKGSLSTRLGIPMIYGIDAVHGHNNVYKATIFPHNIGLGATRQVCRDPRWGRCYESYSEDHKIVQAMTEIIPGLQGDIPSNSRKGVPFVAGKKNVAACAKHYVGDGGTTRGINENNTGFVISDWEGIDRITSPPHANYTYSILASINAGLDMIMVPNNYKEFIDGLTYLVKNKFIPMSRIDDAVKRILRVKFVMGLFEDPLADDSLVDQLGSQEHRELAREAVRKSLVLLKNGDSADAPLLPLPKKAPKILVAGSHANNLGYQCGGWTIEWQGQGGNNITDGTTILTAIKKTVDPKTKVVYKEKPDAEFVKSNDFSYAIVVVGEHPYAETNGDSLNLTIPEPGPSTIGNVCGAVKCVVVVISGRPVVIQPYVRYIDAIVAAWLPGSEGQGVADVLFGDYGFTGKLSFTWFKTVDQLPMHIP
ncbi:Glycoside hydrolase [Theobroma cacao]|nr:Glycoside hydrolase [Theobroma cacao]